MGTLFGLAVALTLPIYLIAQIVILFRWRGWALWLTLPPMLIMGAAVALFVHEQAAGSNLAPLFMVLVAPFCLLWVWVIWMFRPTPATR